MNQERPILFSGPMVRAILAGTKAETRRIVKPGLSAALDYLDCDDAHDCVSGWRDDGHSGPGVYAWCSTYPDDGAEFCPCPYGAPGDRLWVRETWASRAVLPSEKIAFRADGVWGAFGGDGDGNHCFYRHGWVLGEAPTDRAGHWLGLPVFGGRWRPSIHMPRWASRLTLAVDAVRVERLHDIDDAGARAEGVADREAYRVLWCDINGAESWDANPWVWVVGFSRLTP